MKNTKLPLRGWNKKMDERNKTMTIKMNVEKIKEMLTEILVVLDEKPEIDVSITEITTLVVKSHDEPEPMTWHEAMGKFGPDGTDKEWRLPNRFELDVMYKNKSDIPILTSGGYWSSTEYNTNGAWAQRFSDGNQVNGYKYNYYLVRCVRR